MQHAASGRAVVGHCFQGYNSCIFAYGQTGSGKTHTMLGDLGDDYALCERSGLTPRIFDHLLREMHRRSEAADEEETLHFECHVSMLEVYNETVMDLLNPEACNLDIREDAHTGMYVEGLTNRRVLSGALQPQRNTDSVACIFGQASYISSAAHAQVKLPDFGAVLQWQTSYSCLDRATATGTSARHA